MERKIGLAMLAGVIAFAILDYGIGAAGFKHGLDIQQLKDNATTYAIIGGIVVAALVLMFSGNAAGIGSAEEDDRKTNKQ